MNTSEAGTTTEAVVLSALVLSGKRVLVPFGDGCRYDLAWDDDGRLVRVQCKTGRLRKGCVVFNAHSQARDRSKVGYAGVADFFGVYCPDTGQVYLVPVVDVGTNTVSLRVDPPKKKRLDIRYASDFIL